MHDVESAPYGIGRVSSAAGAFALLVDLPWCLSESTARARTYDRRPSWCTGPSAERPQRTTSIFPSVLPTPSAAGERARLDALILGTHRLGSGDLVLDRRGRA